MNLFVVIRVMAALLLMITTRYGLAQHFHFDNRRTTKSIPFRLVKNLIIIPLHINHQGPFNFILDTGVGIMLITEPRLADSLDLTSLRKITITGFGEGESFSASITPLLNVHIDRGIRGMVSAAVLEEDPFHLSSYTGVPIHGLIGYEFFSSFTVQINYLSGMLRLHHPSKTYITRKRARIPLSIEKRKPYIYAALSPGPGVEKRVKLIIDTGAGHPVSLETDSLTSYRIPEPNIRASLGVGLSGPINGYLARIPYVRLGRYTLNNVVSSFPDYKSAAMDSRSNMVQRNGNLGNAILKRFHVTFDYTRGYLYLKKNYRYKEPFEHDMSGMELALAPPDYKRVYIARVEPGSAADEAGLLPDDEILSVNFKPVSGMKLEEIYDLLRSKDGRTVAINILPPGSKLPSLIILELKRRI